MGVDEEGRDLIDETFILSTTISTTYLAAPIPQAGVNLPGHEVGMTVAAGALGCLSGGLLVLESRDWERGDPVALRVRVVSRRGQRVKITPADDKRNTWRRDRGRWVDLCALDEIEGE